MPELIEEEGYVESDSSDNEEQYSKLLSSVSQLDSTQRVKPASRKEITSEVSEYNLVKGTSGGQDHVSVNELAAVLRKKTGHATISKKVKKVTGQAKTLPKPLEKPVEEKLKRSIGFEKVKNQLQKWESIVTRNSLKDRIHFPLNNNSVKVHTESSDFLHQFKTSTPLEMEIAKILKKDDKPKVEEKDKEFPLTVEEMLEKRKEMAQLRARLSYSQAKAQRQSKIKSKKYHRILKREKLRQQLKEFELLQKTDPEAALKKLSELDRSRAQERASLRHRNTGHWAKNLSVRAKYDVESRKVLADQLKMSREITQKVHTLDSSDEEEESNQKEKISQPDITKMNSIPSDNPWSVDVSEDVNNFISGYKKYWEEKNRETKEKQANGESNEQPEVDNSSKEIIIPTSENKEEVMKAQKDLTKKSRYKNLPNGEGCSEVAKKVKKNKRKVSSDDDSPRRKDKRKRKNQNTSSVNINPTSGVWIVTPATEESEVDSPPKKKGKAVEIDNLFTELHDRLSQKAKKKIDRMERKLKKLDSIKLNKSVKEKKKKEFDLSLKNINGVERPDMDVELAEVDGEEPTVGNVVGTTPIGNSLSEPPAEIDPKKFIQVKPKKLNSQLPENVTGGEDALDDDDDDEEQQKAIEEAFKGDDVTAEFRAMKQKEEESNKVEIQTSLPGWGSWGGEGIKPPPAKKSKKSRKSKKSVEVKLPPRKDQNRKDIIINENENPKIKEHLVKEVPHPFKSVEAFEANIRTPVGREWVPETAHRKFIQKQVTTQLGAVIEPMDEDETIRVKAKRKTPYKGKVKEKNK